MNTQERLITMLDQTAEALGPALLENCAFVGGCVVGLLLTDDFTKEQVRATDDVDLIVDVINYAAYAKLSDELRARGFTQSHQDDFHCRWRLRELAVDVMVTEERVLGFSNIWYRPAIESAVWHMLPSGRKIRIVSPPFFIATKIEAFKGRGQNDYLGSRDIEDIITLIDGREEIIDEIKQQEMAFREYISDAISIFLQQKHFEYAVESAVRNDSDRADVIFDRLQALSKIKV
ncbi:MAG: hypothetical protein I8H79_12710 [Burkholderiales bacterium]|jgi:predicted nucleotidyltransferase|nr:hypothetical protein [Burkholderiales bacterium]MBH1995187.1 hypothetical protein [Burkholderiales bacterium]MBH2071508.1 hypothetical protein [Burkholderiales bacterium]